jgi:N-acyl-phosphatidylethanolamine-hydrolysing phospholipase D
MNLSAPSSHFVVALLLLLTLSGCDSLVSRFFFKSMAQISEPTRPIGNKITSPLRTDVGLSVLWVGHATVLIQIHDKVILTDPVFTNTIGLLAKRLTAPGLDPEVITRLNAILISHIHFDHFAYSSLDLLPRAATLYVPSGGIPYTPEFGFSDLRAAKAWETVEQDGLRITPVPVRHFGGRYGFDATWNSEPTWTGYVIEYRGTTILFAGDTGYHPEYFKEIGRRFHIDVALIPIAPIEPREFMSRVHTDPSEALRIFDDVGAKLMIPIHYETFFQGLEPDPGYARSIMERLIAERGLADRVRILEVGEQLIVKE